LAEEDVLMLDEPSEPMPAWTPDAASAPAGDEPWAAGPAATQTSHTDPSPAPAPTTAEELMPWEMGESATPEAASFAAAAPEPGGGAAAPSAQAGELMPWETAPAAELPAPEVSIPAAVTPPTDDQNGGGAEGEDDEDLEMFRTWLQSLKK
jgi:hypothetical protein